MAMKSVKKLLALFQKMDRGRGFKEREFIDYFKINKMDYKDPAVR